MTLTHTSKNMEYKSLMLLSSLKNTEKGWAPAMMTVPAVASETFQLFFTATRGKGPQAMVALDDISFSDKECPSEFSSDCEIK